MLGSLGLFNEARMRLQESESTAASGEARRAMTSVDSLRWDVERLLMITEALWGMVREQHGYTDVELFKRIAEIDLRDGRLDGRVAPTPPNDCPHCGRRMTKHRPLCLFCGKPTVTDPFQR